MMLRKSKEKEESGLITTLAWRKGSSYRRGITNGWECQDRFHWRSNLANPR